MADTEHLVTRAGVAGKTGSGKYCDCLIARGAEGEKTNISEQA